MTGIFSACLHMYVWHAGGLSTLLLQTPWYEPRLAEQHLHLNSKMLFNEELPHSKSQTVPLLRTCKLLPEADVCSVTL